MEPEPNFEPNTIWVFEKVTPIAGWFIVENPINDDLDGSFGATPILANHHLAKLCLFGPIVGDDDF